MTESCSSGTIIVIIMNLFDFLFCIKISGTLGTGPVDSGVRRAEIPQRVKEKMIKTIILSTCLAASSLSLDARAQDERQYTEGPVTLVQEIGVEYGHFEEYIDWLNSTWKPTMEATKKAGIIIDYKVFSATPQSPDHPDIILWITYKNMAALDRGVEEEAVAKKVICSTECQNKARVGRNEYRKVLRREYIRELILK
jgi:hypothetical protein